MTTHESRGLSGRRCSCRQWHPWNGRTGRSLERRGGDGETKDSRLAREFVAALPIELSRGSRLRSLQEFVREQFVAEGMCADVAIHDTDGPQSHAHILLTVRPLTEAGVWQYKTEKEYLCEGRRGAGLHRR